MIKASVNDLLKQIPGAATEQWPQGVRFAKAMQHGTMSVEIYAPQGIDPQTPHEQDELYIVQSGEADFYLAGFVEKCQAGDCLFVPAGAEHRFTKLSSDFVTWVVFWGPKGGETLSQSEILGAQVTSGASGNYSDRSKPAIHSSNHIKKSQPTKAM